ncbi:hypothetical protein OCH239_09090 [Roseivivax halodurans JCM 10272]|uniref:Uncharacterized protein n=1 Tax=Roseivivax halodurans JCM 10272 TaxID=1449350 RepID=X7ECH1_9RHOB|nr:hypothetical protein [Roseivivax halodurans]ETX13642.1 hypothetical protein OCH239_09090 [Roseivivax halodurans JCM 10272]
MSDRPTFASDTGPGRAGHDNIHIPGEAYASCHIEDAGCGICRRRGGDWEHDGVLLHGIGGQMARYVWTIGAAGVPPRGTMCDRCFEPFAADGRLEMYYGRGRQYLADLSPAATRMLFAFGARQQYLDYLEIRGVDDTGYMPADFVLPVSDTEIETARVFADTFASHELPLAAGRAYAVAAIALGLAERDPGFEAAASYFAARGPYQDPEEVENTRLLQELMETCTVD